MTNAAFVPERIVSWWRDGFGWCRFLGHRFVSGCEECLRCGAQWIEDDDGC